MNNFDKAEAIEDLFHCHDKRELAKMVVKLEGDIQEMVAKAAANKLDGYRELSERVCKAEEELASCQRMYANACATLGEIQGYLGNDIVGIEPGLVKQVIDERDALAAYHEDLICELTACQSVLHNLAHDGQVTPEYANDAK